MDITAEKCRAAADLLVAAAERMKERQRFEICAQCLLFMSSADWRPEEGEMWTQSFIGEAACLLNDIVSGGDRPDADIDGLCFSLFECLAVIFRERFLCRPDASVSDIEARLFEYFENSKSWAPDDGNLVTYFYYSKLPRVLGQTRAGTP